MASVQAVLSYANQNFPKFVKELTDFVRFPSIGTDARYEKETAACANWLASHLGQIGYSASRFSGRPSTPLFMPNG
jgi:acetylornithine deacetylase/succinyl-diaminopimelate desuccinylase-like protein